MEGINILQDYLESQIYENSIHGKPKFIEPTIDVLQYAKQDRFEITEQLKTKTKIRYLAAAGEDFEESEDSNLKEMTDPYDGSIRDDFTNCAYTDPVVSPGLEKSNNGFFEKGFKFRVVLKNPINPDTGKELTEEEQSMLLDSIMIENQFQIGDNLIQTKRTLAKAIAILREWVDLDDIDLLDKMRGSRLQKIVQGRGLCLVTPPITLLPENDLPKSLTMVSTEETGNPIVDVSNRKLVAIMVSLGSKKMLLPDEFVYSVGKHWGLRKDSLFFGASSLEAALPASKANKRLINFDITKMVVAGYLQKKIAKISATGTPARQKAQIQKLLNDLVDDGTDIIGVNADVDLLPVDIKIDTSVVEKAKNILEEVLIAASGTTKAQLGRTANLNRDTATIMEIANIKYSRNPDEDQIAQDYETQLLNPLLGHLVGIPHHQLPIKIKIERIESQNGSMDSMAEKKSSEIESGQMKQSDSQNNMFGAAGIDLKKKLNNNLEEELNRQLMILKKNALKN